MADERDQHEPEVVEDVPAAAEESKAEATKAEAEQAAEATEAEEKPKPKRRRKKADETAEDSEPKAESKDDAEEPTADEDGEQAKPAEAEKPKRRRGAAEVSASEPKAPRREVDGKVIVRAKARYVRCAPRKARLVVDHIRGKSVDDARAILIHTPRAASRDVLKLLDSAIANAENNHELVADELKIDSVFVDEGPTLKRFQPRAQGRATRIRKRTSHMTILLTPKE
jgi:ribosomal protein L22